MISKTIGFRGTLFSDNPIDDAKTKVHYPDPQKKYHSRIINTVGSGQAPTELSAAHPGTLWIIMGMMGDCDSALLEEATKATT